MELKYTEQQVTNQDGNSVNMLLYGEIGSDINASMFVDEMQWHNKAGNQIQIKINSVGGKVFDGYGIMDAVEEFGADTYIVGLAASMAGVIAQVGKRRRANHRAVFMAHAPSGGGSKDLLSMIKKTLSKELTDRSALTEDEITNIMDGKSEVYYDADSMYAKGLIDELVTTGQKLTNVVNKTNKTELYEAYNSLINLKQNKMEKVLMQLDLPENRTESDIVSAVKGLQAEAVKVDELENKLSESETKVTNLEKEIGELKVTVKDALIAKATLLVENSRIDKKQAQKWIDLAVENYDLVAETLGAMKPVKNVDVVSMIDGKNGKATEKDYKYMAVNEPENLATMLEENPEEYERLEKAYINKSKTN